MREAEDKFPEGQGEKMNRADTIEERHNQAVAPTLEVTRKGENKDDMKGICLFWLDFFISEIPVLSELEDPVVTGKLVKWDNRVKTELLRCGGILSQTDENSLVFV